MTTEENAKPDCSDEEWHNICAKIFDRGDRTKALSQLVKLHRGEITQPNRASKYYFWNEVLKSSRKRHPPMTVILNDKTIFLATKYIADKYFGKFNLQPSNAIANVCRLYTRNGRLKTPYGTFFLPTAVGQFRVKDAQFIWNKYNKNGVAYDYSCGWGGRLLGALSKGLKYYGVDTNPTLCERLKECAKDYAEVNGLRNDIADIRCSGSEVLQSDWVGKVGVAFSSPPYFDMEIYPGDKTSTTTCPDYGKWLEEYWKPTVVNACEYLIDGGYFLVNITDAYYNDMKSVVLNSCPNMKYICDEHYDGGLTHRNAYRHQRDIGGKKPNPERVMVFQKVANIEPYEGGN